MRKVILLMMVLAAAASAKAIISTIDAPDTNISGLAWGDNCLWAMDAVTDFVYQLDPATGAVQSSFYFPHATNIVPTGLAYSDNLDMLYLGGWYSTTGYVYKYTTAGAYQGMVDMCGG